MAGLIEGLLNANRSQFLWGWPHALRIATAWPLAVYAIEVGCVPSRITNLGVLGAALHSSIECWALEYFA